MPSTSGSADIEWEIYALIGVVQLRDIEGSLGQWRRRWHARPLAPLSLPVRDLSNSLTSSNVVNPTRKSSEFNIPTMFLNCWSNPGLKKLYEEGEMLKSSLLEASMSPETPLSTVEQSSTVFTICSRDVATSPMRKYMNP